MCDITLSLSLLPTGSSFFPTLSPSLSLSSVTSHGVSCGIREMIKEDSFKYLSSLSLMASQSRWARRWQEESVKMPDRDWEGGIYVSLCVDVCVLHVFDEFIQQHLYAVCGLYSCMKRWDRTSLALWAPVNRCYTSHRSVLFTVTYIQGPSLWRDRACAYLCVYYVRER